MQKDAAAADDDGDDNEDDDEVLAAVVDFQPVLRRRNCVTLSLRKKTCATNI